MLRVTTLRMRHPLTRVFPIPPGMLERSAPTIEERMVKTTATRFRSRNGTSPLLPSCFPTWALQSTLRHARAKPFACQLYPLGQDFSMAHGTRCWFRISWYTGPSRMIQAARGQLPVQAARSSQRHCSLKGKRRQGSHSLGPRDEEATTGQFVSVGKEQSMRLSRKLLCLVFRFSHSNLSPEELDCLQVNLVY